MSGLEKFQQTDSWRMNFKKLLFTQRTPVLVETLKHTDRFSLDIAEDLEVLIGQKKRYTNKDMEDKENKIFNENVDMLQNNIESIVSNIWIDTHIRSVDDSFETLEQICNKTASDPNSTLFRYLHSDNKDDVLDAKRNEINRFENAIVMEQENFSLLQHIQIEEEGFDVTKLEDIEAPSQLWENTITNEKNLQASPVKMIGLLRPSTIMEENIEDANNTNETSQSTYYTALKNSESELSTTFESATGKKLISSSYENVSEQNEMQKLNKTHTLKAIVPESEIYSNSIIEVLSGDEDSNFEFENEKDNSRKEHSNGNNLNCENSFKLNDTMEEVEFLLRQRIEYMKSTMTTEDNQHHKKQTQQKDIFEKTDFLEPNFITPNHHIIKDSNMALSDNKVKMETAVGLDIKPFPKLNLFKHPASSGIPKLRSKEGTTKQFAHVVSPIGAYMKNTAVTPLMSTMKTQNRKKDIVNSTAFRELESASRLCQPPLGLPASRKLGTILAGIPSGAKSLPKKAYISSDFKQVKDERTPLMIPGGKKIQKYLEPAMLPAVVRHDGKVKMVEASNKLQNTNTKNQNNNASLADLSLASGDMSLYTIIDARKF